MNSGEWVCEIRKGANEITTFICTDRNKFWTHFFKRNLVSIAFVHEWTEQKYCKGFSTSYTPFGGKAVSIFVDDILPVKTNRFTNILNYIRFSPDLCKDVKCKKPRGAWCQVVEVDGSPKATCVCPKTCPGDQGSPVCSVFGKQYDSACELHKYACKKRKTIPMAFDKPCIGE